MKNFVKFAIVITLFSFLFGVFSVGEVNAQKRRKAKKIYKKHKKKTIISRKLKKNPIKLSLEEKLRNKKHQILGEILKRMDEHNKLLTSLKANVQMSKMNLQLNVEDVYEGTVAYRPNGKDVAVRIDWKKPRAETLAVLHGEFLAYTPSLNQAITGKVKLDKNINLAFLNMSKFRLKESYKVDYLGKEKIGEIECWHLVMTPKIKADYKQTELWVDGNGMPRQAKVMENNGDITTVLLTDLQKNAEIPGSFFQVSLPKGVKKVKG